MTMTRNFVAALLLLAALPANALSVPADQAHCFESAAQRYGLDTVLLIAIGSVESKFNSSAFNKNRNGSRDIGIMQINSFWFPTLRREYAIEEQDLYDPCINIAVGAWVLAGNIQTYGATWEAVGAYNARSRSKRLRYIKLVKRALKTYE